jgi:hypothetical protein
MDLAASRREIASKPAVPYLESAPINERQKDIEKAGRRPHRRLPSFFILLHLGFHLSELPKYNSQAAV